MQRVVLEGSAPRKITRLEVATAIFLMGGVVVALVSARVQRWVPIGDDAVLVTRAADVLSAHPPHLGMPTSVMLYPGTFSYHPGPLLFVWFAPWVAVFGTTFGGAMGAAALNVSALAVAWVRSREVFGRTTGLLVVLAGASVVWSGNPVFFPINSSVSAAPLFAVLVLAWTTLRSGRGAVAMVVFGSIVGQAHVAYGLVAVTVFAPVLAWHVARTVRTRTQSGARAVARIVVPWVGLLGVLWLGTILDGGRNLKLLATGTEAGQARGLAYGASVVVNTLGIPPAPGSINAVFAGTVRPLAAVVFVLVVGTCARACQQGHRQVRAGVPVLGLALAAAGIGSALGPARSPLNVLLFWSRSISVFAWILFACAAAALAADHARGRRFLRWPALRRTVAALAAVVALGSGIQLAVRVTGAERSLAESATRRSAKALSGLPSEPAVAYVDRGPLVAEQVAFGSAARRIEDGGATLLSADWYWGKERALEDRKKDPATSVFFTTRPVVGGLPENWTLRATTHGSTSEQSEKKLAMEVASHVNRTSPVRLTDDARDRAGAAVDGLLPGSCADLDEWLDEPQRFTKEAPLALLGLYREGLVASPSLPPALATRVQETPPPAVWVYVVEGHPDPQELERSDRLVLNHLGCRR